MRWFWVAVVVCVVQVVESSEGDYLPDFIKCYRHCVDTFHCSYYPAAIQWGFGDCFTCRHECVWKSTARLKPGYRLQFYGKWPFIALPIPTVLGTFYIQEPASVLFSLMNLVTVYILYRRVVEWKDLPMRGVWKVYGIIGILVWCCSSIFHCVDCWLTEWMDYFSAFALILIAFYASLCFVLRRSLIFNENTRSGQTLRKLVAVGLTIFYLRHCYQLMDFFDYGYNMRVCVSFSVATTLLYLWWLARNWTKRYENEAMRRTLNLLAFTLIWMNGSVALELLEFEPWWWTIDAHSLFHLATVPVPIWFSNFLLLEHEATLDFRDRRAKSF